MIKLLRSNNEPAIIVDADQKPVFFALNAKGPFEVYLPQLVRRLCPKEFPAFKLLLIAVLVVSCEDFVYGFSGERYALDTIYGF
jgi:hypothetical protein